MATPHTQQLTIRETVRLPRKLKPNEQRRVERLGKLNDARWRAVSTGNASALLKLAEQYEKLGKHGGCPRLASAIRVQAEQIAKGQGRVK